MVALVRQTFPKDYPGCYLGHLNSGNLAQERHRPACPRVDFQDIGLMVVNDELVIHNSPALEGDRQLLGGIDNLLLDVIVKTLWWVNRH